jgi:FKBP-type peptidyl-prolyl cis-trans isomerase
MNTFTKIILPVLILLVSGCGSQMVLTMENGLVIEDVIVGDGTEAERHSIISVDYTGRLEDGTKFDSSLKPGGNPYRFTLGARQVIAGWDQGLLGMKVGGKRKLTIPPELGYGSRGKGVIPPNSVLIFEIELLGVE